jgi:polar amino acid transport system substrate-binding protein
MEQLDDGADLVKVVLDGPDKETAPLTVDEVGAVVDAAHTRAAQVTAHSTLLPGARVGTEAGVDSLEHGLQLDLDVTKAMAAKGICTGLDAGRPGVLAVIRANDDLAPVHRTAGALPAGSAAGVGARERAPAGKFTVGTDKPAYSPWFVDEDPANGKGLESAVAYAVAEQLGFAEEEVTWVVVPLPDALAPGPKNFDVDVNQVRITEERRQAVDFSSGYYDVAQTVITTKGSTIDGATTIAALKEAKLGAQVGSTSYTAITDQIQPTSEPAGYDTTNSAAQALAFGQVDGIVVDLPTAFYVTTAQLDDGVIVGQLPTRPGIEDQFGMVLAKGSPLTPCIGAAVDELRDDGTIEELNKQWLTGTDGAPI